MKKIKEINTPLASRGLLDQNTVKMHHRFEMLISKDELRDWNAFAGIPLAKFVRKEINKIIKKASPTLPNVPDAGVEKGVIVRFTVPPRIAPIYKKKLSKSGAEPKDFWLDLLRPNRATSSITDSKYENATLTVEQIAPANDEQTRNDVGHIQQIAPANPRAISEQSRLPNPAKINAALVRAIREIESLQEHYSADPIIKGYMSEIIQSLQEARE